MNKREKFDLLRKILPTIGYDIDCSAIQSDLVLRHDLRRGIEKLSFLINGEEREHICESGISHGEVFVATGFVLRFVKSFGSSDACNISTKEIMFLDVNSDQMRDVKRVYNGNWGIIINNKICVKDVRLRKDENGYWCSILMPFVVLDGNKDCILELDLQSPFDTDLRDSQLEVIIEGFRIFGNRIL
jgi:hypothetical protein